MLLFCSLDAPIERVTGADLPTPYAEVLEQFAFPQVPIIAKVARRCLVSGDAPKKMLFGRSCELTGVLSLCLLLHSTATKRHHNLHTIQGCSHCDEGRFLVFLP